MAEFVDIAAVEDFREGKIRRYFLGGKEIAVVLLDGAWHAFGNRCTHADFQLHFGFIEDDKVYCPIHYAAFEILSGRPVEGPFGIDALKVYSVRVEGGRVWLNPEPVEVEQAP
jgi:nitrite reductase/ring-hydroxylating ferredoxin subunit